MPEVLTERSHAHQMWQALQEKVALRWLTCCQNPRCCAGPMELDLESVASACLTQSGEAAANIGLLRSCIQGSPDPAAALVKALKVFTSETFSAFDRQRGHQAGVKPARGMLGSNSCMLCSS